MSELLLDVALEAAVGLRIELLRRLPAGDLALKLEGAGPRLADVIAEHGDDLMFRSKRPGESARVFNAVADGLALLAFCPGGVHWRGRHWVAAE